MHLSYRFLLRPVAVVIVLLWLPALVWGQQDTLTYRQTNKPSPFSQRLQQIGAAETQRSIDRFEQLKLQKKQEDLLRQIQETNEKAKLFLRSPIDSQQISESIDRLKSEKQIVVDGLVTANQTLLSHRNIIVSGLVLKEQLYKINLQRKKLESINEVLESLRFSIDSISADPALYLFDNDSATATKYIEKMRVVAMELGPTDTLINKELEKVTHLLRKTISIQFDLIGEQQKVNGYQKNMNSSLFKKEPANHDRFANMSFADVLHKSWIKEKLALSYYLQRSWFRLVMIVLVSFVLSFLIVSLKQQIEEIFEEDKHPPVFLIFKKSFLAAVIIIFNIFQFVFIHPPFIYSFILWAISAIALSQVLRGYITSYWYKCWVAFVILFLLSGFDNFILFPHIAENWYMLTLSISGILLALYVIQGKNRHQLREKQFYYFSLFVLVTESCALAANIGGLYNLSKVLMVSGFSGFVIAILFLWTIRLVNELLNVLAILHEKKEVNYKFINLKKVVKEVPNGAYLLVYAAWAMLIVRNFYGLDQVVAPISNLLNEERVIGSYSFSINGIFTFLIVISTAVIISKLVGFFSGDGEVTDRTEKVNLGSWVLLIRIFVICTGLFLGLAAAGIPLDKLTIVLGALGVGIGLGLQNLVNNLVSGLILAFERPLNIGDLIDYKGQLATVKKIGFRSSHILLKDGPMVVIPNGDLVSNPVTNYTLSRHNKRIKLRFTVAPNTDLEAVEKIINRLLSGDKLVMPRPQASIDPVEFLPDGIIIEVLYWVYHLKDGNTTLGNLIKQLQKELNEAGIAMAIQTQHIILSK